MSMSKEDIDKSSFTDDEKEDLEQQEQTPVIRVHERSKCVINGTFQFFIH